MNAEPSTLHDPRPIPDSGSAITLPQLQRCQRTIDRVVAIKDVLVARYRRRGYHPAVIRDAIAAAEAQAWLSGFPHLVLPALADELAEHLHLRRLSAHADLAQAA